MPVSNMDGCAATCSRRERPAESSCPRAGRQLAIAGPVEWSAALQVRVLRTRSPSPKVPHTRTYSYSPEQQKRDSAVQMQCRRLYANGRD